MTLRKIHEAVQEVRRLAPDSSGDAHQAVDRLWRRVLRAIAAGADNAAELAEAALETEEIDYARWYE